MRKVQVDRFTAGRCRAPHLTLELQSFFCCWSYCRPSAVVTLGLQAHSLNPGQLPSGTMLCCNCGRHSPEV